MKNIYLMNANHLLNENVSINKIHEQDYIWILWVTITTEDALLLAPAQVSAGKKYFEQGMPQKITYNASKNWVKGAVVFTSLF